MRVVVLGHCNSLTSEHDGDFDDENDDDGRSDDDDDGDDDDDANTMTTTITPINNDSVSLVREISTTTQRSR